MIIVIKSTMIYLHLQQTQWQKNIMRNMNTYSDKKNSDTLCVIIPAYQAEKTIDQCLESILNQTVRGLLQIVVINDGSTDNTKMKVNEFVLQDDRVTLINQTNQGVASARNTGVKFDKCKYTVFVDSDDTVESSFFERLLNVANKYDPDLVMTRIESKAYYNPYNDQKEKMLFMNDFRNDFEKLYLSYSLNSVCGKLYKTEEIKRICFYKGMRVGEDLAYNFKYILNMKKAVYTSETGYLYTANIHSSTHRFAYGDFAEQEKCRALAESFCIKTNVTSYQRAIDVMYLRNIIDGTVNAFTYLDKFEAISIISQYRDTDLVDNLMGKYRQSTLSTDIKRRVFYILFRKKKYKLMWFIGLLNRRRKANIEKRCEDN